MVEIEKKNNIGQRFEMRFKSRTRVNEQRRYVKDRERTGRIGGNIMVIIHSPDIDR